MNNYKEKYLKYKKKYLKISRGGSSNNLLDIVPDFKKFLFPIIITTTDYKDAFVPNQTYEFKNKDTYKYYMNNVSLKKLKLIFSDSIDDLTFPSDLTELEFGDEFNQPIAYMDLLHNYDPPYSKFFLPNTITTLKFGKTFNQPIGILSNPPISYLPESIKTLVFGNDFNQEIGSSIIMTESPIINSDTYYLSDQPGTPTFLPKNLHKLVLGCNFNNRLFWHLLRSEAVSYLPDSIEELELFYYELMEDNKTIFSAKKSILLPKSLKQLTIKYDPITTKYNPNFYLKFKTVLEQIRFLKPTLQIIELKPNS